MKKLYLGLCVCLLLTQCKKEEKSTLPSDDIRLNQVGYHLNSQKEFLLADHPAERFKVIDSEGKEVFEGNLTDQGQWKGSGESLRLGDFSALSLPGTYTIVTDNGLSSHPFSIEQDIFRQALHAAIKSYYFQRASTPIEETYGGIYKRPAGHPDDQCIFHPSSGRESGTLSSSGGWYDAGDYGKYIVNASLSTGQMLHLLEQYPDVVPDGALNIPESGNDRSDLLDELLYELNWILTMQDPDGGVYHKLTAKNFSGFIMPGDYDLDRYIIGKGTAASLNFSAVLAQASRLLKQSDPEWSEKAVEAAVKAWKWALNNDDVAFMNPEDVSTGQYDDDHFSDDFFWAAAELYLATEEQEYLDYLEAKPEPYVHELTNSWKFFVRNNGFHSLLENKDKIPSDLAESLHADHLALADGILSKIAEHPYNIALDRFEWGSNSDILNQAVILCVAHRISGEEKYLVGAERINDYIFGKNATGFSFLTGFGSKQVMFPHHRPSGADGIELPVPGFIVGGPNDHRQDKDQVQYGSEFPAKAYEDVEASFASNEVCINWNAPAVYVLAYLHQARN